ncbi:PDR/VanB family oxidoreductase [Mycolicibacterium aubagnense]|uniref:Oxidoreductase n=1 Tax=Mycolicibacterium aubagnense TaxID=319707 RepID=A0ABN5YPZ3_9MYCO|nr:PDR/VanB family oxidoreductase [Mycolicibacterium aubagnense]WGI34474.1 PDR/VanB family oxidoreductase [Mycolicibacterium aubagnense]BBX83658.1 putative oxidoreductase [Mycolicibacterium aubagnense]
MSRLLGRPAAVDDPTPALKAMGQVARGYSRLFTESRIADRLSPARPVRRAGYDARLEVVAVDRLAADVVGLTLSRPDRSPLPRWTPGAHIDVFTPSGRQRHYSLTGDRFDPLHYRIAVRQIPDGAGSTELHRVRVGDTLRIRGPRNAFSLAPADDYVFIAGGIGITPILPMVREVASGTSPWRLVYTGRSRESMPFIDELTELGHGQVLIRPDDQYGTPNLAELCVADSPRAAFYVCGPPAMIERARNVATVAAGAGTTAEFHSERFSAAPIVDGRAFTVTLTESRLTVDVGADESALAAIRRVKPDVQYSCQQGFCGACRVQLVDGVVEHRDRVLTPDQHSDSMMICVSRAQGDSISVAL